jgi:hypothetical protein
VGALQTVLARRVAVAAWRLARADRLEIEVFEERGYANASPGLALMRDGNGTRSFETLLRYRGAAMAEFWRALRTLKALQAEQALDAGQALGAGDRPAPAKRPLRPAAQPPLVQRPRPNEPERALEPGLDYLPSEPPAPRVLHEPAAPWRPNEAETTPARPEYLLNEPPTSPTPHAAKRTRDRSDGRRPSPEPAADLDPTSGGAQRADSAVPRLSRRS